ncbi:MAG: glycosyltransferase family 4 protein [Acidobacteriota bacterium]|nr:MAG: glycosyltransferase family 4 protein [Acidobacteriota bacterium]
MKILQVCSAETIGGGERHVIDLTRALIERGHDLHLAVRPNSPLRAELAAAPVTWHELGLRNAMDVLSAHLLAGIIREHRIDVLHAHVARDYTFCGIAARMSRPVRFFLTRHHFNPIRSNPIYAWTLAEARALIAVSETVREQLEAAFPDYLDRIHVIPNWIDYRTGERLPKEKARADLGITRRYAAAIIGQLTPLKRQDLFIQAAAHLIRERYWTEVDFLIVGGAGPEDEEYVAGLQKMIHDAGVENQVRFTGYIDELPAHLIAFDIVAAPSDNEAFSLALVEAMAAGCAVVATRVGGMAEIVTDGVTGILIEPNDKWALVTGLSRLLADRPLREKIAAAGRESVIDRFDRERVIDRIEALYRSAGEESDRIPVLDRRTADE